MVQSLYESTGGATIPALAHHVTGSGLGPVLDPLRDALIELYKAALNAELGEAWAAFVSQHQPIRAWTSPVMTTYHRTPAPDWMSEVQVAFPLLTLERSGEGKAGKHTLATRKLTQTWHCHWGIPPVAPDIDSAISAAFNGVRSVIDSATEHGKHPAYTGTDIEDIPGLLKIDMTGHAVGNAEFPVGADTFKFRFIEIELVSEELMVRGNSHLHEIQGFKATVHQDAGAQGTLFDAAIGRTPQ